MCGGGQSGLWIARQWDWPGGGLGPRSLLEGCSGNAGVPSPANRLHASPEGQRQPRLAPNRRCGAHAGWQRWALFRALRGVAGALTPALLLWVHSSCVVMRVSWCGKVQRRTRAPSPTRRPTRPRVVGPPRSLQGASPDLLHHCCFRSKVGLVWVSRGRLKPSWEAAQASRLAPGPAAESPPPATGVAAAPTGGVRLTRRPACCCRGT